MKGTIKEFVRTENAEELSLSIAFVGLSEKNGYSCIFVEQSKKKY